MQCMQLEPCNYNNYSTLKIINAIYTTMQYLRHYTDISKTWIQSSWELSWQNVPMCTKLCQQCSAVQLQRPGPMWHNSREATDGLSDVPWHRGVMWGYYHHRVDIGLTPSANCLNLELTHRTKEAKWIKANIYKMTKCSSQKSVAIRLGYFLGRKEKNGDENGMEWQIVTSIHGPAVIYVTSSTIASIWSIECVICLLSAHWKYPLGELVS